VPSVTLESVYTVPAFNKGLIFAKDPHVLTGAGLYTAR
jgi:hypothetical protein